MCNPIEKLFCKTIPDKVWHYTSLAALEGILTSGRMWATDCRFTNDSTEFIHTKEIAVGCIESLQSSGSMNKFPSLNLLEMLNHAFNRGALSPFENEVYLVSFSERRDLLTQWTQYADDGRGVSIAFDLRNVRPPVEAKIGVTFAPCVYAQDAKKQLVQSAIAKFTDKVEKLDEQSKDQSWVHGQLKIWNIINHIYGSSFDRSEFEAANARKFKDELLDAWRLTLFDLIRVASHCKNDAFFAEHEWRLSMPRPKARPSAEHPVKYRGANREVPYFESDLFSVHKLPIIEIMAGPLCTEHERISEIVQQNCYSCDISRSMIPLRAVGG